MEWSGRQSSLENTHRYRPRNTPRLKIRNVLDNLSFQWDHRTGIAQTLWYHCSRCCGARLSVRGRERPGMRRGLDLGHDVEERKQVVEVQRLARKARKAGQQPLQQAAQA